MIKNFTIDSKIDVLLDEKLSNIDLGKKNVPVCFAGTHETLRKVFQEINKQKLSCVPILDEQNCFLGAIYKWDVEIIFKLSCFEYVSSRSYSAGPQSKPIHGVPARARHTGRVLPGHSASNRLAA